MLLYDTTQLGLISYKYLTIASMDNFTIKLSTVPTHIDSFSLFPAIAIDLTLKSTPVRQQVIKHVGFICIVTYCS